MRTTWKKITLSGGEKIFMVTYKLTRRDDKTLEYAYYPKGKEDKEPGIIVVDFVEETIRIIKGAEADDEITYPVESFAAMRECINRMRREEGEPELTEEELPTVTEPETCWMYGQHALHDIMDKVNAGDIPETGTVMWY